MIKDTNKDSHSLRNYIESLQIFHSKDPRSGVCIISSLYVDHQACDFSVGYNQLIFGWIF